MKILGLEHRADGVLGYLQSDESYKVILKAPKDKITNLEMLWGDPYDWEPNKSNKYIWQCKMISEPTTVESDQIVDYFSFVLSTREQRFKYFFKFKYENKIYAYGEFGLREYIKNDDFNYHGFAFTWNHSSTGKYIGPKKWWNETSWYQIFPDRFASDKGPLPKKTVDINELIGGNINGIIEKLDYIKELGFNGIYLNPIFKASSNHKYDTIDYFKIDPDFGTMKDFEKLVQELKKRNMRIMLDGVFNHIGWDSPQWLDVLKNKEKSQYKDWFTIWDMDMIEEPKRNKLSYKSWNPKSYSTFGDTPTMPRLRWKNEVVSNFICSIINFWSKKGIDAWRMDVADEVSFEMWRKVRTEFKKINPEGILLGEIWYDSIPFLHGDQFDTTMNYPFRLNSFNYFVKDEIDEKTFVQNSTTFKYKYSEEINRGLFNLMGSHDTPRLFDECDRNEEKTRMALGWLLLSNGTISFYYGDEINLSSEKNKDNREPFIWKDAKKNKTYMFVKKIMEIRNKNMEDIKSPYKFLSKNKKIIIQYENGKEISFDKYNGIINIFGKEITTL